MKQLPKILDHLMVVLASRRFFKYIVGPLVVEAGWIALTSQYPMAFDEDYHLGIIRIYAHHLNPFLNGQPAGADLYGAVARDPSYLYHYLLSFPYRLINVFTHDQTIQVIILRFVNIGLFVWALELYRRLLLKVGAPLSVVHGCLMLFVLIPVVPLLAGQINYDNLFIPSIAICLLLAIKLVDSLRRKHFNVVTLLWLASACLFASLVKYAFLPIFIAIGMFVIAEITRFWYRHKPTFGKQVAKSLAATSRRQLVIAIALLAAFIGLFSQRYFVNLAHYGTPIPDCSKVLTVEQCSHYGPWIRDYDFENNKLGDAHDNPLQYSDDWLRGMWTRLYFAVAGPTNDYQTRGPLPVPAISAIVIFSGGVVALLTGLKQLLRRYDATVVLLFLGTSGVYITTLFWDNYKAYLRTGQPVAVNGRYLLPLLPLLFVLAALAGQHWLAKYPRSASLLAVAIVVSQLWGGGALTYILRSNDSWYWPSESAKSAHHFVQQILEPVTPGYNEPDEFLPKE
jgi:hypothetical protein